MPLGMVVGLGPCLTVLDGDPAPSPQKAGVQPPIFDTYLLWSNGWMNQDATWYRGRPRPRRYCVAWGTSSRPQKRGQSPNFRPMSIMAKRLANQDATWYGGRPQPRPHCARCGPSSPHEKGHSPPPNFRSMSILAKRSPMSAITEHLCGMVSGVGLSKEDISDCKGLTATKFLPK